MKSNQTFNTRNLVLIGMLSAVAAVLMLFEIPLPFIPGAYKLDISELPVLIGAFAISPLAGVVIEFIKILLNLLMDGTITMYVGELANFLIGVLFVLPAALIYHHKKTKKNALIGLVIATIIMSITACFINAFIILPAYAYFSANLTMQAFIDMGSAVNIFVKDLYTFLIFAVFPFNLIKCVLASVLTLLIYKQVAPFIKGYHTQP